MPEPVLGRMSKVFRAMQHRREILCLPRKRMGHFCEVLGPYWAVAVKYAPHRVLWDITVIVQVTWPHVLKTS